MYGSKSVFKRSTAFWMPGVLVGGEGLGCTDRQAGRQRAGEQPENKQAGRQRASQQACRLTAERQTRFSPACLYLALRHSCFTQAPSRSFRHALRA